MYFFIQYIIFFIQFNGFFSRTNRKIIGVIFIVI